MKRISIAAVAVLILIAGNAIAQRPGGPGRGGTGGPGPNNNSALADYLSLTTDQKASWETIQSELRTSVESLHTQERALGEQLKTALEGSDATLIGTLMLQLRAIREQIRSARDAADTKFEGLLSSDQKAKFEAFQAAVEFLQQRGPGGPDASGGPR